MRIFRKRMFIQTKRSFVACLEPANISYKRLFLLGSALHQNLHLIKKASIFVSYVIKQLVHAFSCAYIELWMHSGS